MYFVNHLAVIYLKIINSKNFFLIKMIFFEHIICSVILLKYVVTHNCGIQPKVSHKLDERIIGGTEAFPNSWPWTVSLHSLLSDGKTLVRIKCGGLYNFNINFIIFD